MKIAVICKDQNDFLIHPKDSENKYVMLYRIWMVSGFDKIDKIELTKGSQENKYTAEILRLLYPRMKIHKEPIIIESNPKNSTVWFNEFNRHKESHSKDAFGYLMEHHIEQMAKKLDEQILNPDKMKITKDTKISELIPEGYELATQTISTNGIHIDFKKKEVKDFDWYVRKYLKQAGFTKYTFWPFQDKNYRTVPFEIKIGLLKFICDDKSVTWMRFVERRHLEFPNIIKDICPKEFLDSIFN